MLITFQAVKHSVIGCQRHRHLERSTCSRYRARRVGVRTLNHYRALQRERTDAIGTIGRGEGQDGIGANKRHS